MVCRYRNDCGISRDAYDALGVLHPQLDSKHAMASFQNGTFGLMVGVFNQLGARLLQSLKRYQKAIISMRRMELRACFRTLFPNRARQERPDLTAEKHSLTPAVGAVKHPY